MDPEVAPCDANSSASAQKKKKKHKKRHNFKENNHNHTDHGQLEGTSTENRSLDNAPHKEPPANDSTELDPQIDSIVKLSEKNKSRNKQERRHCALKDKALGHDASERTSSKTESSAEVGLSHKKTNKGKRQKRKHNDSKTNGIDHDLHEGGHMSSSDLTIMNDSENVDGGFISDTCSIKNHDEKTVDAIDKRNPKIKTYHRRKTDSSENNLESTKEDGMNSSLQVVQSNSTGVYSSKPASEKRKKKMDNNSNDASDENVFVKMLVDPAEISEPVTEVKLDKMKTASQDEAENMEETEVKEIIPSSSHLGAIKDDAELVNREENPPDISQSQPERAVICHSGKKLLILDVNGLLADILPYPVEGYKPDIIVSRKSVFKRPFCDDFLQFCFERFEVGVWSSRTKKNVNMVLEFLMADCRHKLLFCWDQSQCTNTGFTTHDNSDKPLLLKELRKLWDKHEPDLPWEKGDYNESNTLLLDDSPYKALLNPAHTAIFPYSYEYTDTKDDLLAPRGRLRVYLERLAMADNVQKYVQQNPFGQRAITKSSATWTYYSKVVRRYSYTREEERRNSSACQHR